MSRTPTYLVFSRNCSEILTKNIVFVMVLRGGYWFCGNKKKIWEQDEELTTLSDSP